ncbi:unnamed protein product [Phytophthora fragariaefolia]|uniref:Unnamed protein product n=1 Tax=Phytophthora fragariaefolia TaxID=1490495 RepID=A0A9W6XS55_9STRA|nr:unnamed protein product [Phytophthora fragariaefolia]
MARTKKKRTCKEIEQAMRDNERVNATPAAPEEPAAKNWRQARRRSKRYNLNKEFQALAVDVTEGTTAAASRPPVTTAVQDPAPGTGVPLAPRHTPILAPTVNVEQQRLEANPAQGRRPRASLTASQQERRRHGSEPEELYLPSRNANKGATKRLSEGQTNRQTYSGSCKKLTGFDMPRDAKKRHLQNVKNVKGLTGSVRRSAVEQEQEQAEQASRREYQAMQRDARDDEENEDARQNELFAFTSIGTSCSNRSFNEVNQDESVAGHHGVYTYRIQGAMGHYLGSLLPRVDPLTNLPKPAKFARIYIVDPDMQQRAERRRGIFADLDPGTLLDIEQMMTEVNPFAHSSSTSLRGYAKTRQKGKTSSIWCTGFMRSGQTRSNLMYDPLQYPLLLPHGELGWTYTDTYANNIERRNKREMSLREHVAYRLYQRVDDQSVLHKGGRLFQQYGVDQRAKRKQEQLGWIATHQAELRADQYCGFQDALLSETTVELGEGEALLSEYNRKTGTIQQPEQPRRRAGHFLILDQIGKRVVLPSTHPGGPRHMFKSYQDVMAVVRGFGKPDVFMTMTCSPTWDEIQEKIPDENQSAQDRPDVVARVYQMKLASLLKDLDEGVLGRVQARIYVVEFQKRGLPHAHILAILAEEDKPRTREIIDKLVSAELPDPETNPQLYETILTCMMHGPCGAANPV